MDTSVRVAEIPPRPSTNPHAVPPLAQAPGDEPKTRDPEVVGLLVLKSLDRVGDRTVRKLVAAFGSARAALTAPPSAFAALAGTAAAAARNESARRRQAEQAVRDARNRGLHLITLHDQEYPPRLRDLHDPPSVLFAAGAVDLLANGAVAVVGARRATENGRSTAFQLGAELARAGVVVVSGMALGIDASAHRGALSVSDATIAVLGGGADKPSPRTNDKLYKSIRERGLVLSEFLPGESPKPHHFPKRNRILAALATAVVVVEAAEKSGALITVDHALDLGREVYAVPGAVSSPYSRGTNRMIRDGATILLDPTQLLEELGVASQGTTSPAGAAPALPEESQAFRLWASLETEPRHVDQIARAVGISASAALAQLTILEIQAWAHKSPGARFSRGHGPGFT